MKAYIITGASKGIGFSIASQILQKGHTVLGLSRTYNNQLEAMANKNKAQISQIETDLSNSIDSDIHIREFISKLDDKYTTITLINNAGTIEPIALLGELNVVDVENALALNITVPIMMANSFIRETKKMSIQKNIVNISSGVANKPIIGWTVYGATKAAMDSLTLSIAHEQTRMNGSVKVISFYPGKVDTAMQQKIRNSDQDKFSFVPYFQKVKSNGELLSPDKVAKELLKLLDRNEFYNGQIVDIHNLTFCSEK